MNKLLIVVLAVCLLNVQGFVRREAPAANNPSDFENTGKQLNQLADNISSNLKEFNPDQLQKGFNDALKEFSKVIDDLKKKTESQ